MEDNVVVSGTKHGAKIQESQKRHLASINGSEMVCVCVCVYIYILRERERGQTVKQRYLYFSNTYGSSLLLAKGLQEILLQVHAKGNIWSLIINVKQAVKWEPTNWYSVKLQGSDFDQEELTAHELLMQASGGGE